MIQKRYMWTGEYIQKRVDAYIKFFENGEKISLFKIFYCVRRGPKTNHFAGPESHKSFALPVKNVLDKPPCEEESSAVSCEVHTAQKSRNDCFGINFSWELLLRSL